MRVRLWSSSSLLIAVVLITLVLMTSCGGSSVSSTTSGASGSTGSAIENAAKLKGDDKKAYEAVVASMVKFTGSFPGGLSPTQSACLGVGYVRAFGAKRMIDLTSADKVILPDADAARAADVFLACYDVSTPVAMSAKQKGSVSAAQADCIAGKIPNGAYRAALALQFAGKPSDAAASAAITEATQAAMTACAAVK